MAVVGVEFYAAIDLVLEDDRGAVI
jgi:hypothetical protein